MHIHPFGVKLPTVIWIKAIGNNDFGFPYSPFICLAFESVAKSAPRSNRRLQQKARDGMRIERAKKFFNPIDPIFRAVFWCKREIRVIGYLHAFISRFSLKWKNRLARFLCPHCCRFACIKLFFSYLKDFCMSFEKKSHKLNEIMK